MFDKSPLANAWWNDKRPNMSNINIPTYITGTYSNTMHGMGAIRGWLQVQTEHKWLRWHPTQEWYDMWGNQDSLDDLFGFFDHFLKHADNGWEKTPKVRMAALRYGEKAPISNIVEEDFPLKRTEYRKLYLASNGLSSTPPPSSVASYDSTSTAATFTHTFTETTTLIGIPKAVLYMSTPDNDDMDIYVCLKKLDRDGKELLCLNIPWDNLPVKTIDEIQGKDRTEVVLYTGPIGMLRASQIISKRHS